MIRAFVLVEGQTEETFIRDVVSPSLIGKGIYFDPILVKTKSATGSKASHKGGVVSFGKVENDIRRLLRDTSVSLVTTMIDFYGLAGKDFPGWETMPNGTCYQRVQHLEDALAKHISHARFLPYFALHEFEALLFADPAQIDKTFPLKSKNTLNQLIAIKDKYSSPEEINEDAPPSKRIVSLFPQYNKVAFGALIAIDIGLDVIREQCLHFRQWLEKIEALAPKEE